MAVLLLIVFAGGMFHLWLIGMAQGYNRGAHTTIEKLIDAGLIDESKIQYVDKEDEEAP